MKLKELLHNLDYKIIKGDVNIEIDGISYNSKKVKKNYAFVSIKGAHFDGHDFIKEAAQNGAAAVIIDDAFCDDIENVTLVKVHNSKVALACLCNLFYEEPSKELNLIGVTGTNGKTTVIHYIRDMLEAHGESTGTIGTLGYELKDKEINVEKINPTTPEALELNQILRDFIDKDAKNAVMEVTSSALMKHRVDFCSFKVGVFTNLSQDHLDEHGTMENYKNEKIKLFKKCPVGVINLDDNIAAEIMAKGTCRFFTYGVLTKADLTAKSISYSPNSVSFEVKYKALSSKITVNVPGEFTVYNTLAAIGSLLCLGFEFEEVLKLTSHIKPVLGRLETVKNPLNKNIIIDYAHTPDSLEKLLIMAREMTNGKIITVFGCGGDRDKSKRGLMGMAVGILSDYCIITSDNPRHEKPEDIIRDIERGMQSINSSYEKVTDRREAIKRGIENLKEEDILIIAGKGHEDYQIIGNTKIHFDDREVVTEFLN
ncbi:UDP-N-acetylmuramoyl-L-alanyl-D-glutamate--2,6-diaminopimelate ligase [Clostridium felsineum]|uniref:UDP-N-acetylmuramoyl-L-alanyl-D-glutamate--2, 6-diaminopimelate ligase n=1 Tax=Clostridium felsineum TaxID=36839 RepID=UPI00098C3501|nr:UDP-N-acetylmuramoyl-L-alanyl-D-glutamate--2,6-diaminopimelate ligase [Clostridium felsineum]URZ03841.1 UDP-N-acetylmuramoyl-L-alanyl-D-glutamate--2,6-diaminopimelate ligase [Clostridium felsineum]